jgi:glycerol-3-phosphate dehydrogenase
MPPQWLLSFSRAKDWSADGSACLMMRRAAALAALGEEFDVCIIGGGAIGAGCALDAQLRGLKTILVEGKDFASATSSASTKLIHGGIRYLREAAVHFDLAQLGVVKRALQERVYMLRNAPFLAGTMEFVIPCYSRWQSVYFGAGVKLYDLLAGKTNLLPSQRLTRDQALQRLPMLKSDGLVGAVTYSDGQFDDAGYNLALVRAFADLGGVALNHASVVAFERDSRRKLHSAEIRDEVLDRTFEVRARAFVNATGPAADVLRRMANPTASPRLKLSKGAHILFPLEGSVHQNALLIPKTSDGRVIFAIPWMGRLLVGTTDEPVDDLAEVSVTQEDINYLLHHLNQFVDNSFSAKQIVSGFAGVRPLIAADSRDTKGLSRDHMVEVDGQTGLISILGGKWTTYRAMAEDTVNAVQRYLGQSVTECPTRNHPLTGSVGYTATFPEGLMRKHSISPDTARHLVDKVGTNAVQVLEAATATPELAEPIVNGLPAIRAEIVHAIRNDMALTIDDILARRTGIQFYSWTLSAQAAPVVANYLANEYGWSDERRQQAVDEYVRKLKQILQTAGLGN